MYLIHGFIAHFLLYKRLLSAQLQCCFLVLLRVECCSGFAYLKIFATKK